ncbi:MAG: hypothetical protein B7X77_12135 [Caulobacter sp. 39-67-4]|nr:MAG: hypothetical protein B7X77_12135 [Caulobacter sp. 39-67-4]
MFLTAALEGQLPLERVVEATSTRPARLFRLDRKGEIKPGYDADLVLVDLEKEYEIRDEDVLSLVGWSPYAGRTFKGKPVRTILRGKTIYADGKVVGTSSYLNIRKLHKGLEVGSTFLHPDARSGPVNPESKRLLLANAFNAGAIRVEFLVDVRNGRSQAAVEKLGAHKDGVLRNHKITWTGHVRDTAVFSITDADWPGVKQRLDFRLTESFV